MYTQILLSGIVFLFFVVSCVNYYFISIIEQNKNKNLFDINNYIFKNLQTNYAYFLVACGGEFKKVNSFLIYTHNSGVREKTHLVLNKDGYFTELELINAIHRLCDKINKKVINNC